jgi:hypothetical protein
VEKLIVREENRRQGVGRANNNNHHKALVITRLVLLV